MLKFIKFYYDRNGGDQSSENSLWNNYDLGNTQYREFQSDFIPEYSHILQIKVKFCSWDQLSVLIL